MSRNQERLIANLPCDLIVHRYGNDTSRRDIWETPATFFDALSAAMPGETIIVTIGHYTNTNVTWYLGLNPALSGDPHAPVTFKSKVPCTVALVPANNDVLALGISNPQHIVSGGFNTEGMLKAIDREIDTTAPADYNGPQPHP